MFKVADLPQVISEGLLTIFEIARSRHGHTNLHANLDKFFDTIDFQTEAETLIPENVEKTKKAFFTLCDEMNWVAVKQSFKELLSEKSGIYATRSKDGNVPNWFHELRQVLPTLSALRSNIYTEPELRKHGGIEALLTAKFRHDSYEDYGKTPTTIFAGLESRFHELNSQGKITDEQLLLARNQAAIAIDVVGLVSKKTNIKYIDDEGQIQEHKADFFEGDNNAFYRNTLEHYFAYELKTIDGIEGLSTRIVPDQFTRTDTALSVEKNLKYAREKRSLYGRASMDAMAIEKWPRFREAIRSHDSMLRLNLVTLEVVNDHYVSTSKLKAENAFPMRVNRYLEHAFDCYQHVPRGFNPLLIQIERLEKIAHNEMNNKEFKMAALLENAIYPSLIPAIGDRRGALLQSSNNNPYYEGDNLAPMQ